MYMLLNILVVSLAMVFSNLSSPVHRDNIIKRYHCFESNLSELYELLIKIAIFY